MALLTALLLTAWACTPEAIPPPAPVPSLAAGAPQGNPEEVVDECTCKMSVQSVFTSGDTWTLDNWPYMWRFNGDNTGKWSFYFNGPIASGTSLPTDYFDIPPLSESEGLCDEFRLESFTQDLVVQVKVRCYLGSSSSPTSEVTDEFVFSQGYPVQGISPENVRKFYRQYICQERTFDNPDPCKEGLH